MQEVEGEIETNWKRLRSHLLHGRFPKFQKFEAGKADPGNRVFVWTSADPFYDFEHLEEFCEDGLSRMPRMFARLCYKRFDYRTEVELIGLSFEFTDLTEATHFAIANWIGEPQGTQLKMSD